MTTTDTTSPEFFDAAAAVNYVREEAVIDDIRLEHFLFRLTHTLRF
jgi:hypothetical protein